MRHDEKVNRIDMDDKVLANVSVLPDSVLSVSLLLKISGSKVGFTQSNPTICPRLVCRGLALKRSVSPVQRRIRGHGINSVQYVEKKGLFHLNDHRL